MTGPRPASRRIRTLLVANRGEIACRVLRTAGAMGIRTVAVFSDADTDAPHVAAADLAVRLPGVAAADTYLRADLLVAAAVRTGADAVHPGYGFLSEDAGFARQVVAAGLVFVGPSPEVIEAMGAKVRARALAASAGVPVLPGAVLGADSDPGDLADAAARTGYPLLVKASAGGGGRGMRVVHREADLVPAVASARREAAAAFGDATVFLERYLRDPRHVEVQVLGDAAGTVVSLGERECSVQRRFQKVVEEAPSPAVDPALRARLGDAATGLARALGYVGVGTVEFVLDRDGAFFFLEVNTRLQVEHPVTEMVTGLDLVRLQLLVAQGEPLPPAAREPRLDGHALEARLYAEDPRADFLPTTGRLRQFTVPEGVRVDAGVRPGSEVGPHYDGLLAKVVAHAPTRVEAAAVLAAALRRSRVSGLRTNRELLAAVLAEPEFLAGATDTGYLTRHPPAALLRPDPEQRAEAVAAAVLALRAARHAAATLQRGVTPGWRNVRSADPVVRLRDEDGATLDVRYRVAGGQAEVTVGDWSLGPLRYEVESAAAGWRVVLERDGVRRSLDVAVDPPHLDVGWAEGSLELTEVDLLPAPQPGGTAGSLTAPMPGVVLRAEVAPGEPVEAGQPVLVLEAMKMEHTVRAPRPGVVDALLVRPGEQVGTGQQLVVLGVPGVDGTGPEGAEPRGGVG